MFAGVVLLDVVSFRRVELAVPATSRDYARSLLVDDRTEWAKAHAGNNRVFLTGSVLSGKRECMGRFFNIDGYEPFTLGKWENFVRFTVGSEEFDPIIYRKRLFFGYFNDFYTDFLEKEFIRQARMTGMTSLKLSAHR